MAIPAPILIATRILLGPFASRPAYTAEVDIYIDEDTGDQYISNGVEWLETGRTGTAGNATTSVPGQVLTDVTPAGPTATALTTDGLPGLASDGDSGIAVTKQVAAANEVLSGPGGTTTTHVSAQKAGQTGGLYEGINSADQTVFFVGIDGEVVTADDVIALAAVKANESVTAWGVAIQGAQPVLATGANHTSDDIITFLQSLGFCKQS